MTAQEKATELFKHFNNETESTSSARRCATYTVNGILSELEQLHKPEYTSFLDDGNVIDGYEKIQFWTDVKELISQMS